MAGLRAHYGNGRRLTRSEWNGWSREQRNFFRRQVIASLVPPPRQDPIFYLRPLSGSAAVNPVFQLEILTGLQRYDGDFVWRSPDPIVKSLGEAVDVVLDDDPGLATILHDGDVITIMRRYGGS